MVPIRLPHFRDDGADLSYINGFFLSHPIFQWRGQVQDDCVDFIIADGVVNHIMHNLNNSINTTTPIKLIITHLKLKEILVFVVFFC